MQLLSAKDLKVPEKSIRHEVDQCLAIGFIGTAPIKCPTAYFSKPWALAVNCREINQ